MSDCLLKDINLHTDKSSACTDWLRQLLEPALASILNHSAEATTAASNALTALATLEGLTPGSLQSMLLEVSLCSVAMLSLQKVGAYEFHQVTYLAMSSVRPCVTENCEPHPLLIIPGLTICVNSTFRCLF